MTERQMRAFREFVAAGYSKEGAAALVGNASQESGVNLVSGYQARTDHGSQGIFQWRLDRLDNLIRFCAERSLHSGTLAAQVKFAIYELVKDYPQLDAELRRGGDLPELTAAVCWQYERPARSSAALDRRIKYARQILSGAKLQINAKAGSVVAATSAAGSVLSYLQQGPGVGTLLFVIAAVVIGTVVAAATRPRPEATKEEPLQHPSPSLLEQLKSDLEDLKRAQERVDTTAAAIRAKAKEFENALSLVPVRFLEESQPIVTQLKG
jgi:hypothetical protein